jgi:hypothetical protein
MAAASGTAAKRQASEGIRTVKNVPSKDGEDKKSGTISKIKPSTSNEKRAEAIFGGEPGGTRTRDPVIKSHMLYQLSYRPSRGGITDPFQFIR